MISILTLRLERLLASLKVTESFPLIVFLLKKFLIKQQHRWELLSIAVAVWTFISLLCSFVSVTSLLGHIFGEFHPMISQSFEITMVDEAFENSALWLDMLSDSKIVKQQVIGMGLENFAEIGKILESLKLQIGWRWWPSACAHHKSVLFSHTARKSLLYFKRLLPTRFIGSWNNILMHNNIIIMKFSRNSIIFKIKMH